MMVMVVDILLILVHFSLEFMIIGDTCTLTLHVSLIADYWNDACALPCDEWSMMGCYILFVSQSGVR